MAELAVTEGGASLNAGITPSLESLEAEFSECVAEHSLETEYTVSDLYISLCVLSNQVWIPVSVLGRMWEFKKDAAWDVAKNVLQCEPGSIGTAVNV